MKLLIIGVKWPPPTFIARKIELLQRQGVEITVACSNLASHKPEEINLLKLITFERKSDLFNALWWFLFLLPTNLLLLTHYWKAARQRTASVKQALWLFLHSLPLIAQNTDIVHFEWNSAAIKYLPFYTLLGCPIVISCRGSQVQIAPHNPQRQDIIDGLHESFQQATAVHCVSEDIFQTAHRYGVAEEKVWVIRPAVDPNFFYPITTSQSEAMEKIQLVSTGSIIWTKGYEYALQSIRRLVDNGIAVNYKIIGSGTKSEYQRILYTINDLELEGHVQLTGHLTPKEVRDHLQNADIFLLSSLSEGISNAVLEAMACGVPVVTTDCGGMREAVTDGVEGFVVNTRDVNDMAEKLLVLVQDPELRYKMGIAGRERILKEFTLEQQTQKFLNLYTDVLINN